MHFSSILTVSHILAAGLVAAKPLQMDRRTPTGGSTVQSVGRWTYSACAIEPFNNGGSGRMFADAVKTDSSMTVEMCADFCSNYTYFGVQYASECYCGNTIADGTGYEVDDTNCNFQCAGNANEHCGGSGHASFYTQDFNSNDGTTSISTPAATLSTLTSSAASTAGDSSISSSRASSSTAAAMNSATTSSSNVESTSTAAATSTSSISASSSTSSSQPSSSTAVPMSSTTSSTISKTSSASSTSPTSSITTFVTSTKTSSTTTPCKTSTTTSSAVATATPIPAFFSLSSCPAFSASLSVFKLPFRFTPYYSGSGYTENSANPGNLIPSVIPAKTYTIAGTYNACQAAQECLANMQCLKLAYLSFDLHYLTTSKSWECTAYVGGNVNTKYFNVPNAAVSYAYGFNGLLKF